jgi:hypothetical protein
VAKLRSTLRNATRAKATHAGESLAGKVSIRLSTISSSLPSFQFLEKTGYLPGLFLVDGGAMSLVSSISA